MSRAAARRQNYFSVFGFVAVGLDGGVGCSGVATVAVVVSVAAALGQGEHSVAHHVHATKEPRRHVARQSTRSRPLCKTHTIHGQERPSPIRPRIPQEASVKQPYTRY